MSEQSGVRLAVANDLEALLHLEEVGFAGDRFSRGQMRHLLNRANASAYIIQDDGKIKGAAIMLWRKSAPVGRLYSIVIDPVFHGQGLGARLLRACEEAAAERGCNKIVLEVRADNKAAIALYKKFDYQPAGTIPGYYSDGMNGLRMVKPLLSKGKPDILLPIPYYAQTLDFTCGSASLMMGMKYFDPSLELDRGLELILWKESTTVFMSAGFGGCGPFGLAVAAQRRGYKVKLVLGTEQTPFLSSVHSKEKKEVIRIVDEYLRREAKELGAEVEYYNFTFADIADGIRRGAVPIVLISTYRLHKDRSPHWVTVTGFGRHHVYYHDPYQKFYEHGGKQAQNVRVPLGQFRQVRRFGKDVNRSVLFLEGWRGRAKPLRP